MLVVRFRKLNRLLFTPLMSGLSTRSAPLKRHCLKETGGIPQPSARKIVEAVSSTVRPAGCAVIFAGRSGVPDTIEMALKNPRISTGTVPSQARYSDWPAEIAISSTPKLSPSTKPLTMGGDEFASAAVTSFGEKR